MRHAAAWRLARASLERGAPVALVTVAAVKGSAPREPGACLCVGLDGQAGSIGGGTLEYQAVDSARELLRNAKPWLHQQLGLGPALGQCCGGRVELLIERLDAADLDWLRASESAPPGTELLSHCSAGQRRKSLQLAADDTVHFDAASPQQLTLRQPLRPGHFELLLFGAGHLGQALVPLLANLPCTLHWFDAREADAEAASRSGARCEWLETPTLALQQATDGSLALVMTHSHALDFEISAAALACERIAWVGMIGSASKRQRFERELRRRGEAAPLDRLACPIGQRNSALRDPAELALVLAAELLQARSHPTHFRSSRQRHA